MLRLCDKAACSRQSRRYSAFAFCNVIRYIPRERDPARGGYRRATDSLHRRLGEDWWSERNSDSASIGATWRRGWGRLEIRLTAFADF